jgi:hypothetical protein
MKVNSNRTDDQSFISIYNNHSASVIMGFDTTNSFLLKTNTSSNTMTFKNGSVTSLYIDTGNNFRITAIVYSTTDMNCGANMDISGNCTIHGSGTVGGVAIVSDRRLKSNIKKISTKDFHLDNVDAFSYTIKGKRNIGLISQQVQKQCGNLDITIEQNDKLYLDYNQVIALPVAEVKELKKQISTLM